MNFRFIVLDPVPDLVPPPAQADTVTTSNIAKLAARIALNGRQISNLYLIIGKK